MSSDACRNHDDGPLTIQGLDLPRIHFGDPEDLCCTRLVRERRDRQERVREDVKRDEKAIVPVYHVAGSATSAAI